MPVLRIMATWFGELESPGSGRTVTAPRVGRVVTVSTVAGLVYASLYVKNGWLGQFLVPLGIEGAYSRLGIVLVLTFTGFPWACVT